MDILIPKKYTKFDHIKRVEAQGKHAKRTAGSYVLDLVDLKKTVVLCDLCRRKFNLSMFIIVGALHCRQRIIRLSTRFALEFIGVSRRI